ncbi:MAG TPA: carbamoyltransferase [Candidatus Krumholzibacteriaceae bacterium]
MNILGISCFYHDSAATLVRDGEILAAAQEERFTRRKHDMGFPKHAIKFCLDYGNITANDLDYVAFYDKPLLKFERILEMYIAYAPRGLRSFLMAIPLWIREKAWIPELIRNELGYEGPIIYPEHHQSHAASAFFPSPFGEAAFITMDGVGEKATSSYGVGCGNKVTILAEQHFPHSLGLLYSAFTYYTGFKVNSGEYKVMGLAPYGEPKYVQAILDHLIDLKDDGSFKMNMEYFNYVAGLTMTNEKFHRLLGGAPRRPEGKMTQRDMDLARSVQDVTEEVMFRTARHVHRETGQKNLCLAGGVALNCVGNGKILRDGSFEKIWIQPAAGDAGGSLGAALFAWYQYLGNPREADGANDMQKGSYLGPAFTSDEVRAFLDQHKLPYRELAYDDIPETVADLITSDKVVGWFQGRMEFGPRALGSRSILGDARSSTIQKIMNLKIKFRESFRPFAPSVLAERVSDYFDLGVDSPYMLLVADVVEGRRRAMTAEEQELFGIDKLNVVRSEIPAVTHIDYSARIQTVHRETNPLYHRLISAVEAKTGCPVIVNTSFNVRGEPIICSPLDAYTCFMRTEMDYLVMEDLILDKKEQPSFHDEIDWRKTYELD